MKPAIVLPLHDPSGLLFAHLETLTPKLKELFDFAFVSLSPTTQQLQSVQVNRLAQDGFFRLNFNRPDTQLGDHYISAYQSALTDCSPEQVLHLCDIDKVACILNSEYRELFVADIRAASFAPLPLLFQRSARAWNTFPANYRECEYLGITVGQLLFDQYFDFTWSHLVLRGAQLRALVPHLQRRDTGLLAEMVLLLKANLHTRDVDWLVWEDPYIYGRDLDELRAEREQNADETYKRLKGMKPILDLLFEANEQGHAAMLSA